MTSNEKSSKYLKYAAMVVCFAAISAAACFGIRHLINNAKNKIREEAEGTGNNTVLEETTAPSTAMEIHLPLVGDDGFEWTYSIEDDSIVDIVEEGQLAPWEKTAGYEEAVESGAVVEDEEIDKNTWSKVFVIDALKQGETDVVFVYERGTLETGDYAYSDKVIVHCTVANDLSMTCEMDRNGIEQDLEHFYYNSYESLVKTAGFEPKRAAIEDYFESNYFYDPKSGVASIAYGNMDIGFMLYSSDEEVKYEEDLGLEPQTDYAVGDVTGVFGENESYVMFRWKKDGKYYGFIAIGDDKRKIREEVLPEAVG